MQAWPRRLSFDLAVRFVACGATHSLLTARDGSVWAWGSGSAGQLGLGDEAEDLKPRAAPARVAWTARAAASEDSGGVLACGAHHSAVVDEFKTPPASNERSDL